MTLKPPGYIELIHREVVLSEDRAALAELAKPAPCDKCELHQHCADTKQACKAFVAFVHGHPGAWHSYMRPRSRKPTAAHYAVAMGEAVPKYLKGRAPTTGTPTTRVLANMATLAHELVGRVVNGREVVRLERQACKSGYPALTLCILRCPKCRREIVGKPHQVRHGTVGACRCVRDAQQATTYRANVRAEFVGKQLRNGWRCVDVEFGPGTKTMLILRHDKTGAMVRRLAHRVRNGIGLHPPDSKWCRAQFGEGAKARRKVNKAPKRRGDTAAARKAQRQCARVAGAALDARFLDPEQWKPCAP
jgi:hypothetical protein